MRSNATFALMMSAWLVVLMSLSAQAASAAETDPATQTAPTQGYCVIPIRGVIGLHVTDAVVERCLDAAEKANAHTIILEIDSPGGLSAELAKISKRIVDWQSTRKAVAFVNPRAHSAAAIIAISCKDIFMAPASTIGATAEIGAPKDGIIRIKHDSVTRAADRALAQFGGHDPVIVEGMFDPDIEVWMTPPKPDDKDGKYTFQSVAAQPYTFRPSTIPNATRIKGYKQILTLSATDAVKWGFAISEAKEHAQIGLRLTAKDWQEVGQTAKKVADTQYNIAERLNREVEDHADRLNKVNSQVPFSATAPILKRHLGELRSAKTSAKRLEQILKTHDYYKSTIDENALNRASNSLDNAISSLELRIQRMTK